MRSAAASLGQAILLAVVVAVALVGAATVAFYAMGGPSRVSSFLGETAGSTLTSAGKDLLHDEEFLGGIGRAVSASVQDEASQRALQSAIHEAVQQESTQKLLRESTRSAVEQALSDDKAREMLADAIRKSVSSEEVQSAIARAVAEAFSSARR